MTSPLEIGPHGDGDPSLRLQVRFLILVCYWSNLLDAVFTASHLTNGAVEWNLLMRFFWTIHPAVYATAKFLLFRVGMEFVERAFPAMGARRNALVLVAASFTLVNLWHLISGASCASVAGCPLGF